MFKNAVTRSVVLLGALTTTLHAQRSWIVDAKNGAGSNFTTIQAAIDAAKHGDRIFVRSGNYAAFTSTKGVRVIAISGATIQAWLSTIRIASIAKPHSFVMRGFQIVRAKEVILQNNSGNVHFENVDIPSSTALSVQSCASVSVHECGMNVKSSISQSSVSFTNCNVTAHLFAGSDRAFDARASRLTFARTTVAITWTKFAVAAHAVGATNSHVRIHADCRLQASGSARFPDIAAALGNRASHIVVDPSAKLIPAGKATPVQGFGSAATRVLPTLNVSSNTPGTPVLLEIKQAATTLWIMQFGLPSSPQPVAPFGNLGIAPSSLMILGAGIAGTTPTRIRLPTPAVRSLVGEAFAWQCVSGVWPRLEYSNTAVTALR